MGREAKPRLLRFIFESRKSSREAETDFVRERSSEAAAKSSSGQKGKREPMITKEKGWNES